jgi:hypothetical protein
MNTEYLSIVLLEDLPFEKLIHKLENAFKIEFPYSNYKGRNIGKAVVENYEISIIDRIDNLGDFLCDDHHTLEIKVNFLESFDYSKLERELKEKLKAGNVSWERGVWTTLKLFNENRIIFPNDPL